MATCPNCGHSGQANRECADKSSQIIWDGGALCTGISSGTLNDIIREQSLRICALSSSISALSVSSSNVAISGQIGTCITASAYLDDWVTAMETYLCGLDTTVQALDPTAPVYYNSIPTVIATSPTYVVYDTVAVPAATINEAYEYLQVEAWVSVSTPQTGRSVLRVSFLGKDIDVFLSNPATMPKPFYRKMKVVINFRRGALSTAMDYDYVCIASLNGREVSTIDNGYAWTVIGSTVSPVDWAVANSLVVSAYNDSGSITVSRLVITKFNIN